MSNPCPNFTQRRYKDITDPEMFSTVVQFVVYICVQLVVYICVQFVYNLLCTFVYNLLCTFAYNLLCTFVYNLLCTFVYNLLCTFVYNSHHCIGRLFLVIDVLSIFIVSNGHTSKLV